MRNNDLVRQPINLSKRVTIYVPPRHQPSRHCVEASRWHNRERQNGQHCGHGKRLRPESMLGARNRIGEIPLTNNRIDLINRGLGQASTAAEIFIAMSQLHDAKQLITQLDAKLLVSKAMIGDVVGVQAAIGGETDKQAIAQQATMMSDMASGMAVATELATMEGDNIVSSLHYANNQVNFNGKQMSVEEFVAMAFATGGGLGAGMGGDMSQEAPLIEDPAQMEDEGVAEETALEQ